MADFLKDCQEHFGTKNLYEILGLKKTATENEIKSAYRKKSLKVHPDRAKAEQKENSKEAFQTLTRVHVILSNEESRKVYDENGMILTDDVGDGFSSFTTYEQYEQYWRTLFPKITTKQIDDFMDKYIGTQEEIEDLKKLYLKHEGNMNMISECHMGFDDEDRIRSLIDNLIESNDVPSFKAYTHESDAKRKRRANKYAKEEKEAESIKKTKTKKDEEDQDDLIMAIRGNQSKRLDSLISSLESKYTTKKGNKKGK